MEGTPSRPPLSTCYPQNLPPKAMGPGRVFREQSPPSPDRGCREKITFGVTEGRAGRTACEEGCKRDNSEARASLGDMICSLQ